MTRDVSVLLRILAPRSQDESDPNLLEAILASGNAPPSKTRQNERLESICTSTSQARAAALAASFKKVVDSISLGDDDDDDEATLRRLAALPSGYVDSGSANSNMLHKPSGVELQTRALSSLMDALNILNLEGGGEAKQAPATSADEDDDIVDEWEALRDCVCQRRTGYSTSRLFAGLSSGPSSGLTSWANSRPSSPPAGREDVDGGQALQRIWRRWKMQVDNGELDRFL